jgi:hypothetical protein
MFIEIGIDPQAVCPARVAERWGSANGLTGRCHVALRHTRNRHARCRRLQTDRPLLLVRPKPFRPTRHHAPIVSNISWWTLSTTLYARQSSGAGRLRSDIKFHLTKGTIYTKRLRLAKAIEPALTIIVASGQDNPGSLLGPNAARILRHTSTSVLILPRIGGHP